MYTHNIYVGVALTLVGVSAGSAQQREKVRSAAELVAEYAAGRDIHAPRLSGYGCPSESARRDSLVVGLLRLEPTPSRVIDMASSWVGVMSMCQDARISAWYRAQADRSREFHVVNHLAAGLLAQPSQENLKATEAIAFDRSADSSIRTSVMTLMVERLRLDYPEQVELLVKAYDRGGSIPEPFNSNVAMVLKRSMYLDVWRTKLLDALVANPGQPGAVALLETLGTDVLFESGSTDRAWKKQFQTAMEAIARDPKASADLRRGIARTNELLVK